MKRKVRIKDCVPVGEDFNFQTEVIKDLLYQIDYQTAHRHNVVTIETEEMIEELKKLPTSVLLSLYFAYLYIRRELMHAGYELNGLKVLDVPLDTIHDMMTKDPDFDLQKYIF
ncbi:hypothetical protein JXB12_05565 [candidate division KSB1 bacterium]|nr:hypothetical protein [candidate division KSB1 bacterium]